MASAVAFVEPRPTDHGSMTSSEALVDREQSQTIEPVAADEGLADGRGKEWRDSDGSLTVDQRWNRHKALLLRLYMVENQPLRVVRAFMHARHGFQASEKMYKDCFARWGWTKNQSKSRNNQPYFFRGQNARTRRSLDAPRELRSPDTSRSLEMAIFETRRLIKALIGPNAWRHTTLTLSPAPRLLGQLPDLYRPDICLLYAIHQMRQLDIVPAFTSIGQIFSALPITIHTQHLKSVSGLWLLYRKVLDICMMVGDSDVQLLRMMMLFQAQFSLTPRQARFSAFGYFTNLLSSLARMHRRSPELLDEIFRQGYTTVARTLEEQLGPCHPSVLQAWGNLAWYWTLSEEATQHVIAMYTHVLKSAEAAYGSCHAIYICMLCDFAILVYHSGQQSELGLGLAGDLWECVQASALTRPPGSGSPLLRVAAMAAVLKARTSQPENNERAAVIVHEVCGPVLSWLESSYAEDVMMVAVMLQADQALLLKSFTVAGIAAVDDKQFNFLRPRCFDIEREEN